MNSFRPKAIDLFCGAGGSSYGAQAAGVEIVAGLDIWKPAIDTYQANFPAAKAFYCDIRQICTSDIHNQIGNIDIILASPECTNHSRAKGAGERSEESKQTAFQVIPFAEEFLPTWLIIENVVEMKSWDGYKKLLNQLKALGYFVRDDVILNAKHFGVPQSRTRLFMLCSRLGMPDTPLSDKKLIQDSTTILRKNTYKFTPLRRKGRAKATITKADHAIGELGGKEPFLIVYYGSGKNGKGGWQRVDKPLRTVTTLDRFAYVVPYGSGHRMRMLQPEELKLAMGFDNEFKLDEVKGLTRRDRVKLMGNGVCPPVMEAIVKKLVEQKFKTS